MLPEIVLDDVRFQELVSEARSRIVRHAPDWTEHNVSDPGITLIELFAWLTEILSYRIDRIPARLHLALLGLIGVRPGEAQTATAELRFMLAQPGGALIPAGTEVASTRAAGGELIVFQTTEDLEISQRRLVACALQRGDTYTAMRLDGERALAPDSPQALFGDPPAAGAALMLGFDQPIAQLVIRVAVDCSQAQAQEVDPFAPPLAWEASGPAGEWLAASVVSDETGAFLLGAGTITVEVPAGATLASFAGQDLHWLRCRLIEGSPLGTGQRYLRSPELAALTAAVAGGTVAAGHACTVSEELIGTSYGVSGSSYQLQHRPVLPLGPGEVLQVRERGARDWVSWRRVDSFATSAPYDQHFMLDSAVAEVRFGPAIRQPDGGWRRYGAVAPAGAAIRMSRYRHGGGAAGNVAPRTLQMLPTPIEAVASVTNPRAASGGVDAESLQSVSERAQIEIRARTRAVTAGDFEALTLAASSDVARALCVSPDGGRAIRVHVLPRVAGAGRKLELADLTPGPQLMATLAAALNEWRLLGTSIRVLPVAFKAVSVVVDLRASPRATLERVQTDVEHALYVYLNPLTGGSPAGPGEGWPRGRALNQGELFGIVYAIEGVEFVNILRMYETDLRTGQQAPRPIESQLPIGPDELIASGKHIVKATYRE